MAEEGESAQLNKMAGNAIAVPFADKRGEFVLQSYGLLLPVATMLVAYKPRGVACLAGELAEHSAGGSSLAGLAVV